MLGNFGSPQNYTHPQVAPSQRTLLSLQFLHAIIERFLFGLEDIADNVAEPEPPKLENAEARWGELGLLDLSPFKVPLTPLWPVISESSKL